MDFPASSGMLEIPSIDSYCNFPKYPTVYIVIARIPDIGPNPTKITKNIAHIILGKLLAAARKKRTINDIHLGFKFLAATRAKGSEIIEPKIVEMKAIFNVSIIPIQAVEHVKSKRG